MGVPMVYDQLRRWMASELGKRFGKAGLSTAPAGRSDAASPSVASAGDGRGGRLRGCRMTLSGRHHPISISRDAAPWPNGSSSASDGDAAPATPMLVSWSRWSCPQEDAEMMRRRAMRRMMRRRRRRRLLIGGMLIVGSTTAMRKMTQQDAEKIQQTTGKSPETMEPEELDQAMAQAGIVAQPVTPEDQQAMAAAEAADPNPDEEVEAPE